MPRANTVIFEEKYGVDISAFSSTTEIDEFVARKEGKKSLEVVSYGIDIVSTRGDVLPMSIADIDKSFDKVLKK